MTYRLFWVTDVGFAGLDEREFACPDDAMAAAPDGLIWKMSPYGQDHWYSNRDRYGDAYSIRPNR